MIEVNSWEFTRATSALCMGSFMIFANVYISQPLLPMLAESFALSALEAGMSFTVTTLTLGLSLLFYGPLSDALGRKWIMVLTMAGATLCTLLLSQVYEYGQLLFLRALQGFFLGGLPAIAIAYMGDEYSKRALTIAVGLYISGNTLGGIGGRLLGGFIGDGYGWPYAFLVMSVVSLFCLVIFAALLPGSKAFRPQRLHPLSMVANLKSHLLNPLLLVAYLIGGLNFLIFINQYSYATFMLSSEPHFLSPSLLGLLFLTYISGTLGSAYSGKITARYAPPLVMAGGIVLLILGSSITLFGSVFWVVAGFLVNAFGFFTAHSTASSWVGQHSCHARASASSLYLVFYYLGASVGGFYLDPFWQSIGWEGVIYGSWLVLGVTLSLSYWLYVVTRFRDQKLNSVSAE